MIKSSVEKLARDIGFDIGASDDIVQADLLNGFCDGLYHSIPCKHDQNRQYCSIVDKLTPTSHKVLKNLFEFMNLKSETMEG